MSANAMIGDREMALAAGMNDHVAEPIKLGQLFGTLARWIRPSGVAGTAAPLFDEATAGEWRGAGQRIPQQAAGDSCRA